MPLLATGNPWLIVPGAACRFLPLPPSEGPESGLLCVLPLQRPRWELEPQKQQLGANDEIGCLSSPQTTHLHAQHAHTT